MKIFDQVVPFATKVNFVDENNVVLGYDMATLCCEYAGWFIADVITNRTPNPHDHRVFLDRDSRPEVIDMPGWCFDTDFFQKIEGECDDPGMARNTEVAVFRITNGPAEKFMHLFNCHNGYYKHGFNFEAGGTKTKEGSL